MWDLLRKFLRNMRGLVADQATDYARWELQELRTLFVAALGGPLAGLPSAATPLCLELLAELEPSELECYVLGSAFWDDDLGTVAGRLDGT